jgi:hypothetical protein
MKSYQSPLVVRKLEYTLTWVVFSLYYLSTEACYSHLEFLNGGANALDKYAG